MSVGEFTVALYEILDRALDVDTLYTVCRDTIVIGIGEDEFIIKVKENK